MYVERVSAVTPNPSRHAVLRGRLGVRRHSAACAPLTRGLARRGPSRHRLHNGCLRRSRACHGRTAQASRAWTRDADRTPDGVTVRVFPNLSNRLAYHLQLFLPLGLDRYLADHAGSFDVAHLHACRNLPGAIAASSSAARAGVPYVLAPNGTAPRIERRAGQARLRRRRSAAASWPAPPACWRCPTPSARSCARSACRPGAIRVVPNPVDLDEFATRLDARRLPTPHRELTARRWCCFSAS